MSSFPAGLTPADVPLDWSVTTAAGQMQVAKHALQLTLAADWQGVRPLGALASWLSESGAQSLQLDEPAGVLRFNDVTVAGAAHRGQLLSWWLCALSRGEEVWATIGRVASIWATVGFPAADAHAWVEGTGLVVWKTAGPNSAVVFVRPLHGASPMPALRCMFLDQPSASAHRQALRSSLPLTPDPTLDAATGWGSLGWSAWLVAPGVSPGQIASGIQLAENLVRRAPTLAALLAPAEPVSPAAQAPPSPFEPVGGAAPLPAPAPAPAPPTAPPTAPALEPAQTAPTEAMSTSPSASVTPASATHASETPASVTPTPMTSPLPPAPAVVIPRLDLPAPDDEEPALLLERPRVSIPIPDEVPELPDATSSDRFDLWLVEVAADPERTVELLARSLRLDRDAAADLCRQAPVIVARNIAAWEVRKLDAVVRLGGGGRLRWDRITAE